MSNHRMYSNEQGIASFIVTFMLMLILSLTVLSFSQIIRREQQQVLDRQLSSRAYYAAESGINIARNFIEEAKTDATKQTYLDNEKTSCDPDGTITAADYMLSAAEKTGLNCLLIRTKLDTLEYTSIAKGQSQRIPLLSDTPFDSVTFRWQNTSATGSTVYSAANCPSTTQLPIASAWSCPAPLLRIDIVPTDGGSLSDATLMANTYSVFVKPRSGAGVATTTYNTSRRGDIVNAPCALANEPKDCQVRIVVPAGKSYYARVSSYYGPMSLSVCASNGAGICNRQLKGAQALIDSTGIAVDTVHRLQVRSTLTNDITPGYALETAGGLCKRYYVVGGTPGSVTTDNASGGEVPISDPSALCPANITP